MSTSNSPLPQSMEVPTAQAPEATLQATPEELSYAAVGESKGWEQLKKHYEDRKEYFSRYLPGGDSIANLSGPELEGWVKAAAVIMDECDSVVAQIEAITNAAKKSK